jgi:TolB-like protein
MDNFKRAFFIILFSALVSAAAFAKDNLAILPFSGGNGEDGETIAELFSFNDELNAVFSPIPRTSIASAIRNEQNFQMASGMTDPDTIAALGKQLGAQYVLAGNIASLGENKLLVISIFKIDDLQQIAGDVQTYTRIEEIQNKLPGMVKTIISATRTNTANLPKLAIVPFQIRTTTNESEADVLAQLLAIYVVQSGKYAVYPRTSSLEQVQDEYRNQYNGDTADDHLVSIGAGINPQFVLSSATRKLGTTQNMFNASIINLETGIQEMGRSVNYQNLNDGLNAIRELARGLTGSSGRTNGDLTSGRKIAAGFENLALGLGSFTTGDWAGGAIIAGGYAAAAGLILWDIFGFEYEDDLAGIPGGIGIGVAAATVVFGFIRPLFFHPPNQNPSPITSFPSGFDFALTASAAGIPVTRLSYTWRF